MSKKEEFESLQYVPRSVIERLAIGLPLLAEAYEKKDPEVFVNLLVNALKQGISYPFAVSDQLVEVDDINLSRDGLMALSFVISAVTLDIDSDEDIDSLLNVLRERSLINEQGMQRIRPILAITLSQKEEVTNGLVKSNISNRLVPSLHDIEYETDIRVQIEEGQIVNHASVALVYLTTDVEDSELYFQMTRYQVRYLREVLEAIDAELDKADSWASKKE